MLSFAAGRTPVGIRQSAPLVAGVGVLDDPAGCADDHADPGRMRTAPAAGGDDLGARSNNKKH